VKKHLYPEAIPLYPENQSVRHLITLEKNMVNNGLVTSLILIGAVALGATLPPSIASAFTQKGFATEIGDVVPIGHEWITRLSALELLGGDTIIKPDPNDPRKTWTAGKAKNTDLSSAGARREADRIRNLKHNNRYYAAVYEFVYASIVGERWVDIGGVKKEPLLDLLCSQIRQNRS
jgi:hypothetical protein